MGFVVDASVACAWVFSDEATPALDDLLEQAGSTTVFVPSLWRAEVMNTLIQASRRQRISETEVVEYFTYLEHLAVEEATQVIPVGQILSLCMEHGLTAYDAMYLALAMRLGEPLATLDKQLGNAARKVGVVVLGYVEAS